MIDNTTISRIRDLREELIDRGRTYRKLERRHRTDGHTEQASRLAVKAATYEEMTESLGNAGVEVADSYSRLREGAERMLTRYPHGRGCAATYDPKCGQVGYIVSEELCDCWKAALSKLLHPSTEA
jgi:hypothetical protein